MDKQDFNDLVQLAQDWRDHFINMEGEPKRDVFYSEYSIEDMYVYFSVVQTNHTGVTFIERYGLQVSLHKEPIQIRGLTMERLINIKTIIKEYRDFLNLRIS